MATPRTPKGRAREVGRRLAETYPEAVCELDHRNPFELLAATILSAQSTDARVNKVTPALFARFPTPEDLAARRPRGAASSSIHATGFYNAKTRSLIGMAQPPGGRVRRRGARGRWRTWSSLPGVGRKTANVVRSVALDLPGLPVDTHVQRLTRRLGHHHRDRPGEDRARAERPWCPPASWGRSACGSSSTAAGCARLARRRAQVRRCRTLCPSSGCPGPSAREQA